MLNQVSRTKMHIVCHGLMHCIPSNKGIWYLSCRRRLFGMINELPTIYEVVTGTAKKQSKEKSSTTNHSSNKSKPISKGVK